MLKEELVESILGIKVQCECDITSWLHFVGALTVLQQFTKNMELREPFKSLASSKSRKDALLHAGEKFLLFLHGFLKIKTLDEGTDWKHGKISLLIHHAIKPELLEHILHLSYQLSDWKEDNLCFRLEMKNGRKRDDVH